MADKKQIGLRFNLTLHLRVDDERYELLARRAVEWKKDYIQQVMEQSEFPAGWREELMVLRKKQRALGMPKRQFLHPRRLREMGYEVKHGRRKRISNGHAA